MNAPTPRYTIEVDFPDEGSLSLFVTLPALGDPPSVDELSCLAEMYALAERANGRARERYGVELVTPGIHVDDDGSAVLAFSFDGDFSESDDVLEAIRGSIGRIIRHHGGSLDD